MLRTNDWGRAHGPGHALVALPHDAGWRPSGGRRLAAGGLQWPAASGVHADAVSAKPAPYLLAVPYPLLANPILAIKRRFIAAHTKMPHCPCASLTPREAAANPAAPPVAQLRPWLAPALALQAPVGRQASRPRQLLPQALLGGGGLRRRVRGRPRHRRLLRALEQPLARARAGGLCGGAASA